MRTISLIAIAAIIVVVLFAGCSRSRTVVGPNMTVTDKGGGTTEVNTPGGKATVNTEKKTITEAELGVPVYPGAMVEVSSSYEGKSAESGPQGMNQTVLSTPDDLDKVIAFYKANLKNPINSMVHEMDGVKMGMFTVKGTGGETIQVNVLPDKEKKVTTIQVMKMKGQQ